MANYILQELPQGMSDGKKVVFPKMDAYSMLEYDKVLEEISKQDTSLREGTIRSVLDALAKMMITWLPEGHSMKIDGLGVFSLSLEFDTSTPSENEIAKQQKKGTAEDDQKTSHRHVRIKKINFKPDAKLIAEMNRTSNFERATPEVITPNREVYSLKERIDIALGIIKEKGFMTLPDYTNATKQSRSGASNDLKKIVASPDSPIGVQGSHSHKVWVKKVNKE
jgi:predicted histone-like DNA-binding protein